MAWLRLDEHIPENTKVQGLAPALFKFWINALCVAKKTDGKFTDLKAASYRLHVPRTRLIVNLEQLRSVGLVELVGDVYEIHDWRKWQYRDSSRQRMRRLRAKKSHGDEMDIVTKNGHVTMSSSVYSGISLEVKSQEQQSASCEPQFPEGFDKWTEAISKRWGRIKNKHLGERQLTLVFAGGFDRQQFEGHFESWCHYHETLGWQFAPTLAEWIGDGGHTRDAPPIPRKKTAQDEMFGGATA